MRYGRVLIPWILVMALLLAACAPALAPTPTPTKAPAEKPAATAAAPQATQAAPTPAPKAVEPKPPVVLGVILALVGPAGGMGSLERQAIELAVEEINAAGGIDGRKIELVVEDDGGEPAKAATAATKLIQKDKVLAVLGAGVTVTTAAAAQVTNAEKVVQLAPAFTGDQLTAPGSGMSYLFRIGWPDRYSVGKLVQYGGKKYSKIGIITDSGPAGQSVTEVAKKLLTELGKAPVATQSYDTRAPDLTPQLLNLQRAGAEAIIAQAVPGDAPTILKGMKQIGFNAQVLGHLGFADPTIRIVTPDAAQGVIGITSESPGKSEQQKVIDAFNKRYGASNDPLYWNIVVVAYDSVRVMAEALKRANFDKNKLKDALESIKDFPAVSGTKENKITFTATQHDGTLENGVVLVQVKGRDLVVVE